jgi:hypothetical protein
MNENLKKAEGFRDYKRRLRKIMFDGYKLRIDDLQRVDRYFCNQEQLDYKITQYMGWKWQMPKKDTEVKD